MDHPWMDAKEQGVIGMDIVTERHDIEVLERHESDEQNTGCRRWRR